MSNLNRRGYLGYVLWSLGFNLIAAICALYVGLATAFALFTLRHILLGVPSVLETWWKIVYGRDNAARLPLTKRSWPNWHWLISGLIYIGVTTVVLVRFNIKLADFLIR